MHLQAALQPPVDLLLCSQLCTGACAEQQAMFRVGTASCIDLTARVQCALQAGCACTGVSTAFALQDAAYALALRQWSAQQHQMGLAGCIIAGGCAWVIAACWLVQAEACRGGTSALPLTAS